MIFEKSEYRPVNHDDLVRWHKEFRKLLEWQKEHLAISLIQLDEKFLSVQYMWKREPDGSKPYIHGFRINVGSFCSAQQCLNDYRWQDIVSYQRRCMEYKHRNDPKVTVVVGTTMQTWDDYKRNGLP